MAALLKDWKPLVNATLEASQSINRTAPVLACTQVLMIILLASILLALFGLLITLNPDLEAERQQFITPAVRFLLNQIITCGSIAGKVLKKSVWAVTARWAFLPGTSYTASGGTVASGKGNPGGNKTS